MKFKKISVFKIMIVLAIILYIVAFVAMAFHTRKAMYDKYYEAVSYYENGMYKDALGIFDNLRGWGRNLEISTEEYYNMCIDALSKTEMEDTMTIEELLKVISINDNLFISESSDGLPKLYSGSPEDVPDIYYNRTIKKISSGSYYNKYTIFISVNK